MLIRNRKENQVKMSKSLFEKEIALLLRNSIQLIIFSPSSMYEALNLQKLKIEISRGLQKTNKKTFKRCGVTCVFMYVRTHVRYELFCHMVLLSVQPHVRHDTPRKCISITGKYKLKNAFIYYV